MKLKIAEDRKGISMAIGLDENNKKYWVIGGDLCYGEIVEVAPYKDKNDTYIFPKINYETTKIFSKYFDKDELIDFNILKEVTNKSKPYNRIYELDNFWVFPEKRINHQIEYLYEKNLINYAKIKITNSWNSFYGRVPVYSVNYIELLKKVLYERQPISSWFFCEREKNFDKGVYADLYVLGNFNDGDLQIQLWQIIGQGDEVLFAHGIIDKKTFRFKHFDLATHFVKPIMIPRLLYNKQRMDLESKKKWIRIDSYDKLVIEDDDVFEMIKMFFPFDYLVDEFIEKPMPNIC